MAKLPSFQFYPGDWKKDANLSRASLSAKGAMIEIMCLAFECEKRGVLKTGGVAWTIHEISMAIGGDCEINKSAIQELLDKKILKKDRKGAIFSLRMCKDEDIRKVRQAAGFKGGNPNLLKQNANQSAKQNLTPSSSSSSSTSINTNTVVAAADSEYKNLDEVGKDLYEMYRRNLDRIKFTDTIVIAEINKFKNKYPGIMVKNAGALVNAWCSNMGKIPIQTKGIINQVTNQNVFL